MRRRQILGAACLTASAMLAACSPGSIASSERARLDSLDATEVVRAYFTSGSQQVELYLSTPSEAELRKQPNYVPEDERRGGVDDLKITGGELAYRTVSGAEGYAEVRAFRVEYVSRRTSSIGEPPGARGFFVYAGKDAATSRWKVLGVGTGP